MASPTWQVQLARFKVSEGSGGVQTRKSPSLYQQQQHQQQQQQPVQLIKQTRSPAPAERFVYLAARRVDKRTKCTTRLFSYCQPGDIIHVEIVVKVDCPPTNCLYCPAYLSNIHLKNKVPNRSYHYLTYAIHKGSAPQDRLFCAVDKSYSVKGVNYQFVQIPVTEVQLDAMKTFLDTQIGHSVNYWYPFNFMRQCCFFLCCPLERITDTVYPENKTWFCSEITTAALQQIGLVTDFDPRVTSPVDLWDRIINEPICTYTSTLPVCVAVVPPVAPKKIDIVLGIEEGDLY